jgi:hypothetical protein
VDQFFLAGADEGDAEQVAVVFVDDHADAAGVAVGAQAGAGYCLLDDDAGKFVAGGDAELTEGLAEVVGDGGC